KHPCERIPRAARNIGQNTRHHRDRRRYQQHRGRLPHHRSHAQNVQSQRVKEGMRTILSSQALLEIIYLIAAMLFILSLKLLSSPATARRGVRAGEIGMLLAVAVTLLH